VFERVVAAFEAERLDGVVFEGALEPSAVGSILSGAAVFCLPSHWEGLPLSLLEAMASGCSVIATSVGDVPFVLEEGAAGMLVPPKDPVALAAAVERLVTDPDEAARLGEKARRRVESEFGRDRLVRRVFDLYAAAAARRGRPRVKP
jgi:glycosyltransferase involved in cell wall biosynthesis